MIILLKYYYLINIFFFKNKSLKIFEVFCDVIKIEIEFLQDFITAKLKDLVV